MADMAYRFFIATKAQHTEGVRRGLVQDNYLMYIYDTHEIYKGAEKYGADNFIDCTELGSLPETGFPDKLYLLNKVFYVYHGEWVRVTEEVDLSGKADKADTLEGYGITDGVTKDELVDAIKDFITTTDIPAPVDISGKADKSTTLAGYGIEDAFTKEEIQDMFSRVPEPVDISGKADKSTTLEGYGISDAYTKEEVQALIPDVSGFAKATDVYSRTDLNGWLDDIEESVKLKAAKATTLEGYGIVDAFTKDEVLGLIPEVPDISGKADKSDVFTKAEVLGLIPEVPDVSGFASKATTLSGYGIADAYTKSEVDAAIANAALGGAADAEVITGLINNISENKADKSTTLQGYGITDTYTSAEIDAAIDEAIDEAVANLAPKATTLSGYGIANAYTKTEIDDKFSALPEVPDVSGFASKSTTLSGYGITDAYTKSEVSTAIANAVKNLASKSEIPDVSGKADKADVFTKAEVRDLIPTVPDVSGKADKSTTLFGYGITNAYTKTETDAAIANATKSFITAADVPAPVDISGKADKSTTLQGYGITNAYTKTETDAAIANATKNFITAADVPAAPDLSGLAAKSTTLSGYGIKDAYTKSEVDAAIANAALGGAADAEAITGLINNISENKADKSTTLQGYGITDSYTKSEVNTAIVNATKNFITASDIPEIPSVEGLVSEDEMNSAIANATKDFVTAAAIPSVEGLVSKSAMDAAIAAATQDFITAADVHDPVDISGKADKATTLLGYGITDAYTKSATDTAISNATKNLAAKSTTLSGYGITDAYTKAEVNSLIPDVSNLAAKSSTLAGYGITNAYTKAEVNSAISTATKDFITAADIPAPVDISGKADKATSLQGYGITDAYTKAQVDSAITNATKNFITASDIPAPVDVSGKADKATTLAGYGITDAYTRAEVNALIPTVPDVSGFATKADTLSGYGITNAYTKAEVDAAIANAALGGAADSEAITQLITGISEEKADKATTLQGYGITDSYTKAEVNTAITNATKDFITVGDLPVVPDVSGLASKTEMATAIANATKNFITASDIPAPVDISGKADKATTLAGYGITDAYTKSQVNSLIPDVSGKANKATTLSGYGITDAYTKSQVDAKIPDVSNFASKGNTYTKAEVDAAIANAVKTGSGSSSTVMPTETLFNVNSNMYHSYRRDGYRAQTMCYNTIKKVWYIIGGPTTGDGTTRIIEVADLRDFPSKPIGIHILNCGHANDCTFNADNQMLYITTGYDAGSNTGQEGDLAGNLLCEIDTRTMTLVRYITIPDYTMVMKVEWHAGLFYIGDFTYGSIYDGNFNLVQHIPSKNVFSWSDARAAAIFGVPASKTGTQGITYINGELHAAMWGCTGKFGEDVKDMGIVYRYALTGEYIGYYMIEPKRFGGELEAVAYKDGAIYSLWYGDNIDIEKAYVAGSVEEQGVLLREGDDLNDCRALGNYHCTAAATCATLLNVPFDNKGFTMYVLQAARSNITQMIVQSARQPEIWMRTWYDKSGWDDSEWIHVVGLCTEDLNEFCYCNGFLTSSCKDIRFMVPSFSVPGEIQSVTITSMNMYVREQGRFLFSNKMLIDPAVEGSAITVEPHKTTTVTYEDGSTCKFVLYKTGIRVIYTATAPYEGYTTNTAISVESTVKGSVKYMK